MYPLLEPGAPGYSKGKASAQYDAWWDGSIRLMREYRAEVAKEYGVTDDHLREIIWEGVMQHWPTVQELAQ